MRRRLRSLSASHPLTIQGFLGSLSERMKKHVLTPLRGKGRRKILRVSRPAKRTNERVLNAAGANRELLDTVRARKLAYYGHTMRKQHTTIFFLVLGALHLDFAHPAHPNVTPLTAFVL